ncbi:LysR family transcriptional regulator [Herbaspirillum hiltneri N3]|uniref:LysR family transcriptional regulator n=1 Tax=Herbaspirillum hiltneri N3 TaxID=1262470 RepID=A0ABN4HTM4_9BURK|nr:LysR family transcriptional regulator [Herbaspirillum hiltneri]AKZ62060.1 LysR family transcriptional regulator [Herbaspirillum hiltneri N3]
MKSQYLQDTALRYFLEVVRCGSIAAASQRLNVASSAISRQISNLESLLDTVLFERRPRGMVLSAGGEMLAAHAQKVTLEADRMVADLLALKGLRRGRIRVAASEGFGIDFLPRVIRGFQQKYPAIQFQVYVGPPGLVSRQVREGDSDIGVTFNRLPEPDIKIAHQQPAPVLLLMRKGHPLSRFKSVTLSQLRPYPLALPEQDTTLRQLFDLACSRQQLVFEPVLTSNYIQTLHNYLLEGDALSLTGEVTVRYRQDVLTMVPISDRALDGRYVEVQTLSGRTLPRIVEIFLDYLLAELNKD